MVSAPKDIGDYDPSARTLVIGVTGHRDLVPEEIPGIEAAVRELLEDLVDRFPRRKLQIMSPLAEGADRIAALVAEDLDIELIAPLPMPENIYAQDFESSRSWAEFSRLLDYATETTTLPLAPGSSEAAVSDYGPERNHQYAEVGAYIAARSDILIAIWDGKTIDDLGGTGREGKMPDYVPHATGKPIRNSVFHIACSRSRANGEPCQGLAPLQTRWLGAQGEVHDRFPPEWEAIVRAPLTEEPAEPAETAAPVPPVGGYRLPLVIGVTGHRDLRPDEMPEIRQRVRELFVNLQERFPTRKLRLLSPLAEGADRLVANVGMELGMELAVALAAGGGRGPAGCECWHGARHGAGGRDADAARHLPHGVQQRRVCRGVRYALRAGE
jgi:hypothetical protein